MSLPKVGVEAVVDNANGYLKSIKQVIDANKSASESVKDTAKQFDVLNDSTDYARSVQKRYSETLKSARSAVESGISSTIGLDDAIGGLSLALGVANVALGAVVAAIGAVVNAITGGIGFIIDLGKTILNVFGNVITGAIDFAKSIMDAIGNAIGFIKDLLVDVGKRLFDFTAFAVEKGMDFSKIMANIGAVTKKSGDEMRDLTNELIALGSESVAGPTAVADAYYDIASGVQAAGAQMYILKQAIKVAEAGQADLKVATQGLVTVFNAYDYGLQEITQASDILTRTTDLGTRTMQEYITAVSPIAGLAASQKVGFQELGAAMAFMTKKGLTAGQSATALQGIMTQLARNTPGVTRALKAMGETSIEASIQNHGLAGTLKLLTDGAKKTGQNLQQLVGRVEAMKAVTMLGTEEFEQFFKTFNEGLDEATNKSREIQRLDVSAQWQLFQARLEGITLSISQAFLPAINKFLQFFNKSLAKIDWKKIGAGLQMLGERLGMAAEGLLNNLATWLDEIDWDKVTNDVMSFLGNLGESLQSIDWESIVNSARTFVTNVANALSPLGDMFANVDWEKAKNDAVGVFKGIADFIGTIDWKALVGIIAETIEGVGEFISAIDWQTLGANVGTVITNVTLAIEKIGAFIAEIDWQTLGTNASNALTDITTAIAEIDWQRVAEEAKIFAEGVKSFFADMQAAITVAGFVIQTIFDRVALAFQTVVTVVNVIKNSVLGVIKTIGDSIAGSLGPAAEVAWKLVNALIALGGQTGGGGGGGGGGGTSVGAMAGGYKGGTLQEGLNLVGEKGAEAIVKHGSKTVVVSHEKTAGLLAGMSSSMIKSMPGAGGAALGAAKSMIKQMSGKPGASAPVPVPVPVIPPMDFMKAIMTSQVMPGAWARAGRALPAPMPVGGNSSSSSVVNNRNIENININNVPNAESAIRRFSRLQAGTRRR